MNKYIESVVLPHIIVLKILQNKNKYKSYRDIYKESIKIVNINNINYFKVYYISRNLLKNKYKFLIISIKPLRIKKVID